LNFLSLNKNLFKYSLYNIYLNKPPIFNNIFNIFTQSIKNIPNYDIWNNYFLEPLIHKCLSYLNDGGHSCWNVGKVGKKDMNYDVIRYHQELNCNKLMYFSVVSSKRQALQKTEDKKSSDNTVVFGCQSPLIVIE
jgi:uncharacterized protein YuzB (UPF0349 family)